MTNDRVRFTIAVDQDVYNAFADMAHTSGVSLSRCIGDWLRDTAEAAQITTIKLNEVRKSPQEALQAFLRDAIVPGMQKLELEGRTWGAGPGGLLKGGPRSGSAVSPPSSNTGGKSPGKTRRQA